MCAVADGFAAMVRSVSAAGNCRLRLTSLSWGVMNLAEILLFSLAAWGLFGARPAFAHIVKDKEQGRPTGLHGGSTRSGEF